MKTCPRCGRIQPPEAFAIDRSKASGRKSHCKRCDRAKAHAYRERKMADVPLRFRRRSGRRADG
jgi:hypothetical protein